ncbi:GAF domain-containing protein [Halovenus salina]
MMAITSDARRFRVLVEQLELPVFVVDNTGTLTHVSPEFAERVGSEGTESLVGKSVTQVIRERDADALVGPGEIPDTVSIRPTQANEPGPQYDLRRVDGEILGCPPPDAVENAEVARALRALHETTRVLRRTESRDKTRSVVIESAVDVLGFDRCLLAEADDSAFEVRATSANCPLEPGEDLHRKEAGLLDAAYRVDEPRVTAEGVTAASGDRSHSSVRSAITVPVKPWGVFQAQSTTPDSFDDRDRRLAEMLVSSFGAAIKRHRRETQLRGATKAQERQRRQIEAVHTVTAEMKSCETRQAVYELTIEAVEDIFSFDICAIGEVESGVLVPKAVGSDLSLDDCYEETPIDQEDNLGSHTYRRGESFVVDDLQAAGYLPAQPCYRSALSLPLGDWGCSRLSRSRPGRSTRRTADWSNCWLNTRSPLSSASTGRQSSNAEHANSNSRMPGSTSSRRSSHTTSGIR